MALNGDVAGVVAMARARQVEQQSLMTGATTDNVPEGSSNLYFTASRARSVFQVNVPLSYDSGTGALNIPKANSSTDGYLSSTDWNTFNGKASAFTGYTGTVTVVTGVDFTAATVTTAKLTYSNGVLTGVS